MNAHFILLLLLLLYILFPPFSDELIKQRNQEKRKERKDTLTKKSIGSSRAKRDAKTAARRGLSPRASNVNAMDVERQVARQETRGKNNGGSGGGGGKGLRQQGGLRVRRSTRVRVARNVNGGFENSANGPARGGKKTTKTRAERVQANKQKNTVKPPSKKAVTAALRAINQSGFKTPKGMKMVISFTPEEKAKGQKGGGGGGGTRNQTTGGKNQKAGGKKTNPKGKRRGGGGGGGGGR